MIRSSKRAALWVVAALAIIGMVLMGCGLAERPASYTTGSVRLQFNVSMAQSILPPISMDVVEYLVSATGPSGSSYGPAVLTGSTVIEDLLPGTWNFNVVGRNAAHNDIGEGAGSAEVVIGQMATCNIVVNEYASPDGSFLLDLA